MSNTYTAITKQDGEWWVGWIEEVPGVNCQEKTHEELIEILGKEKASGKIRRRKKYKLGKA